VASRPHHPRVRRWVKRIRRNLLYGAGAVPALASIVPHRYRKETDPRAASIEFRLRNDVPLRIHPRALRTFEVFRSRNPDTIQEIDGFLAATKDCFTLLDVGAHYGVFSLAFTTRRGATAIAVEPSPRAFPTLEYHAKVNPAAQLRPLRIALGEAAGALPMQYDWEHLVVRPDAIAAPGEQVPVMTIDQLGAQLGLRFDAVKIDVEGFELSVLRGASQLLADAAPIVFLELHPDFLPNYGASVEDVVSLLEKAGYGFFCSDLSPIADPRQRFRTCTGPERRDSQVHRVICQPLRS
jgi:FkbM family methyltransferase